MTVVLGISAYYHDAAAALVVDGELVAAQQEERLSRIKNDPCLPLRAAGACLETAGINVGDIDQVVFYENPFAKLERVLLSLMRSFPRSWRQFPRALTSQLSSKLWVLDSLAEGLGVDRRKIEFVSHHDSHAASAFLCSPYQDAAVLVVDAVGEDASTSIYRGQGGQIHGCESVGYPHSIGLFYAALTAYIGFRVNEGEYKVMGLSAYGTPRYRDEFAKLIRPEANGAYSLDMRYFAHHIGVDRGFSPALEKLLGAKRPPNRPWDLDSTSDQHYADVAATLQAVTEDCLIALAKRAHALVPSRNLCLAGGVALNCVANARIQAETPFERVFVQPAAGDAGGAIGAALLGSQQLGCPRGAAMETTALGARLDVAQASAIAKEMGLRVQRVANPAEAVASELMRDRIVGVVSGRCEWGPRALGARSILALPQEMSMRTRLNRSVKMREEFRPFAPAVLASRVSEFFDTTADDMTPFMTTVAQVREDRRGALEATTHVDGTARVQSVSQGSSPLLHEVLTQLDTSGVAPVLLNTSLNGAGEPIVGGATDALAFFMRHSIDVLFVGDLLIERGQQ